MSIAETQTTLLPTDFLQSSSPSIKATRVDFEKANLPMYKGLYAVILDDVLTPSECETLTAAAEASTSKGWERAMVNIGGGHQALYEDTRNCGRIIWDSRDVVVRIWKRIEHLPEVQEITRLEKVPRIFGNGPAKWDEVWNFTRPNERMRFLKYTGGEYFRPHEDGSYETPDRKERSYFTLHLYLNNADVVSKEEAERTGIPFTDSVLVGGATTFHAWVRLDANPDHYRTLLTLQDEENMKVRYDVLPKAGRILLFQHRGLCHSGDDVISGVKYTMRTDLMYSVERSERGQQQKQAEKDDMSEEEGTDGLKEAQAYGFLNG